MASTAVGGVDPKALHGSQIGKNSLVWELKANSQKAIAEQDCLRELLAASGERAKIIEGKVAWVEA